MDAELLRLAHNTRLNSQKTSDFTELKPCIKTPTSGRPLTKRSVSFAAENEPTWLHRIGFLIGIRRNATPLEQVHEYEWTDNSENSPPPLWKQRADLGGTLLPGEEYESTHLIFGKQSHLTAAARTEKPTQKGEIELDTACTTNQSWDNQSETSSTTSEPRAKSVSSDTDDADMLKPDVPLVRRDVARDTVVGFKKDEQAQDCSANFPARDQCICRRRGSTPECCCKTASSSPRKSYVSAISSGATEVSCVSAHDDGDIAKATCTRDDAGHHQQAVDAASLWPSESLEVGESAVSRSALQAAVVQQRRPPDNTQEYDHGRTLEAGLSPSSTRKMDVVGSTMVPMSSPFVDVDEIMIERHKRLRSEELVDETPQKRMCT